MARYLSLDVYGQSMLVDIGRVEMVSQLALIHPVPDCRQGLEGIVNYRGEGISVISLHNLLNVNTSNTYDEDDNMVICVDESGGKTCIVVKEACDILEKDELELHEPPQGYLSIVKGVFVDFDKDYWVIDVKALCQHFNHPSAVV